MVLLSDLELEDYCCSRFEEALDDEEILIDIDGGYYWADDEPGYRPIKKCPFCGTPLDLSE